MLDMGFLPAIRRIVSILPKDRQTMCFSATMEASVAHLVKDYMKNPVRLAFGSILKPSENVRVQAFEVASDKKLPLLHRLLHKEAGKVLVFARTKRGCERLAITLARDGFAAAMIHGGRTQSQRTAALTGFQRVGRTGRAGGQGVASTLFGREQRSEMLALERTLGLRMERMRAEGDPGEKQPPPMKSALERFQTNTKSRIDRLPGEILQAQM